MITALGFAGFTLVVAISGEIARGRHEDQIDNSTAGRKSRPTEPNNEVTDKKTTLTIESSPTPESLPEHKDTSVRAPDPQAEPTSFEPGSQVKLIDEDLSTVSVPMSHKSSRWGDEDIFARVAPGTKDRIVSRKEFSLADGNSLVRYEVEIPSIGRGWVHASTVHAP